LNRGPYTSIAARQLSRHELETNVAAARSWGTAGQDRSGCSEDFRARLNKCRFQQHRE
jgi:hypothetical protein